MIQILSNDTRLYINLESIGQGGGVIWIVVKVSYYLSFKTFVPKCSFCIPPTEVFVLGLHRRRALISLWE